MPSSYFIGSFQATDEQAAIIEAALRGESFKVSAFAGASKTTTLKGIADHLTFKRILYLAFNKAIADEARQLFPNWVECRTAHSLAYRYIVQSSENYRAKLQKGGAFLPYQDIERYSQKPQNWHPFGRSRFQINVAITETLMAYLNSADLQVAEWHIPEPVIAWTKSADARQTQQFFSQLISYVQTLADEMMDETSDCAMNHDAYLKVFQLRRPRLNFDVILLDEAQDTNPVLQAILAQQTAQKILVGDRHQEIYAWRNAVNTLDKVELKEYPLTHSFRFGQHIAASANRLLQKLSESKELIGLASDVAVNQDFNPHKPYAVMCRTNAKVFEVAEFCLNRSLSYCINGGLEQVSRLIASAYALYQDDKKSMKSPELSLFNSWQEFSDIAEELNKSEWKTIIKFVETHKENTLQKIQQLAKQVGHPHQSHVFISTVHKAKGLGFDQVVLASDFEWPEDKSTGYRESLNVIYVAITRAKRVLLIPKNLRPYLC
jgi:superfamily I DNA/RNA helicase